jgi:hypothetical protein
MKTKNIIENKRIGLKGKVAERFEEAIKLAVDWAYRCNNGLIVIYGGFEGNKLQENLVQVDYVVDRNDIVFDGHTSVPMYVIECCSSELKDLFWGEVVDVLEKEYEEHSITFGALYQESDVINVLRGDIVPI